MGGAEEAHRGAGGDRRGGHLNISNSTPLVSNTVLNCQDQQRNHWKAAQQGIQEAKTNIGVVLSRVQTGNDRLKTVPAGTPCRPALLGERVWTNRVLVTREEMGGSCSPDLEGGNRCFL